MKIKLFCMDVDGTLTDGGINFGVGGELYKRFNVKDGLGIKMLIERRIIPIIITSGVSNINIIRFDNLGVKEIYQGVTDKVKILQILTMKYNCNLSDVAYIGDDLNDLPTMLKIRLSGGVTGCPADSVIQVRDNCDFVSSKNGGYGAVRDFIEWVDQL